MDQAHLDQLLDPQTIARAEALGLQARHIVEGYMAGEHKSPYRGFAIEFEGLENGPKILSRPAGAALRGKGHYGISTR